MKPSVEQIGNLLALKREERPEEGYWQDFLCEFHQKQREQAVKTSGFANFYDQASTWVSDVFRSKWLYGAGLAYASVAAVLLLSSRNATVDQGAPVPVNYQVVPTQPPPAMEQLEQLDLSPSTQGSSGEQVF